MGMQSNYKHTTPSERKQLVEWLEGQETFWLKYTGNTWYDDGHDTDDVNEIVACIRNGIDQGTSKTLRDYVASGTSLEDARHMKVPKWKPIDVLDPKEPKVTKATVREHYINMPNVTRVIPKVMEAPKYVPPKRYTVAEDCQEVERLLFIIEAVDNIQIIRTPESVKRIAGWIRADEHINYRYKQPISCTQVREILQKVYG